MKLIYKPVINKPNVGTAEQELARVVLTSLSTPPPIPESPAVITLDGKLNGTLDDKRIRVYSAGNALLFDSGVNLNNIGDNIPWRFTFTFDLNDLWEIDFTAGDNLWNWRGVMPIPATGSGFTQGFYLTAEAANDSNVIADIVRWYVRA